MNSVAEIDLQAKTIAGFFREADAARREFLTTVGASIAAGTAPSVNDAASLLTMVHSGDIFDDQVRRLVRATDEELTMFAVKRALDESYGSLDIVGAPEVAKACADAHAALDEARATLDKVEEHVRRALCGVIDRLGADGTCHFLNGYSPEELADGIALLVAELEARAKAPVEVERDQALLKLDVANEVIGEVRGACKAGDDELTVLAVRRALREAEHRCTIKAAIHAGADVPTVLRSWVGETQPDPKAIVDALRAEQDK